MLDKLITDARLTRTVDTVMEEFRNIQNGTPTLRISESKKNNVAHMVVNMPPEAVGVFVEHMQTRYWARSALNAELVSARELHWDYCAPGCVGAWSGLLRNTPEVIQGTCHLLLSFWFQHLGGASGEKLAKGRELASARAKSTDVEKMQVASALWHNWLVPKIKEVEPRILPDATRLYTNGTLKDELVRASQARGSAELGAKLSLHAVPQVAALLHTLAATIKENVTGEDAELAAEGSRAECRTLLRQLAAVQNTFQAYVEDGMGVAQRDQILHESRCKQNLENGKAATSDFLQAYARVQHLTSSHAAQDFVAQMRRDILALAKDNGDPLYDGVETVPTVILFEVGQVPLENPLSGCSSLQAERGSPQFWQEMLQVMREECVAAPELCIGIVMHAIKAPGNESKYVYNAGFLKRLQDGRLHVDTEVHMRFKVPVGRKAAPRTASIAKHRTAKQADSNIWTWALQDLRHGELDWGFLPAGEADQARQQCCIAPRRLLATPRRATSHCQAAPRQSRTLLA